MTALALTLALLAAPAAAQEPEPPAIDPAALEVWEATVERYSAAVALAFHSSGSAALEGLPAFRVEESFRGARPASGRLDTHIVARYMDQEEESHDVFLGDGRKVYLLDLEDRTATEQGESWSQTHALSFYFFLGPAWTGDAYTVEEARALPADSEHPGWRGVSLRLLPADGPPDAMPFTLWVDAEGRAVAFGLPMFGPDEEPMRFTFSEELWRDEADPAEFAQPLPADVEVTAPMAEIEPMDDGDDVATEDDGFGPSTKVGEPAPEVTLTMLDGSELAPADLRGKTVLLNFWFYH